MKLFNQIERRLTAVLMEHGKPWHRIKRSHKWDKTKKHRGERHRAKVDPECAPCYRKYCGWEW